MGALTLNVWACALLYEPVEKHLVPPKAALKNKKENQLEEEEETLEPLAEAVIDIAVISPDDEDKRSVMIGSNNNNNNKTMASPTVPKSASSVALENYYKPPVVQGRTRKISMPVSNREMAGQMHSTPALHAVPESNRLIRRQTSARPPPLSPSNSSFNYISTPFHGSTLTALNPEYASTLTLNAITSTFRKSPEKQAKQQTQSEEFKNRFFDCDLLKDPMYLVILISNSTNAISYTNFVIVLTLYAVQLGFTDNQASVLLSIVSLFDLTGKYNNKYYNTFGDYNRI